MEFLRCAVRLASWSAIVVLPVVALAFGWRAAIGVGGGLVWASANAGALAWLVRVLFDAHHAPWWVRTGLWALKLPLLYAVGALLVLSSWSSPVGFLVGFSLWFVLLFVSALRGAAA